MHIFTLIMSLVVLESSCAANLTTCLSWFLTFKWSLELSFDKFKEAILAFFAELGPSKNSNNSSSSGRPNSVPSAEGQIHLDCFL